MVLCCVACGETAGNLQYGRDTELATKFGIASTSQRVSHTEDAASKAAHALLQDVQMRIPAQRRTELELLVKVELHQ